MLNIASSHFLEVVDCIGARHRADLTILAVLAGGWGAAMGLSLLAQAAQSTGRQRRNWCLLAGLIFGFAGWAAHFIIILGYDTGYITGYSLPMTAGSLVVGIVASQAAFGFAVRSRTRFGRGSAALTLAGGLAAMHYTGMAGLDVPATLRWDGHLAAASVMLPVLALYPALVLALRARTHGGMAAATGLTCAAILILHFTGTAALSFIPSRPTDPGFAVSPDSLAAWLCAGCGMMLAAGAVAHTLRQRSHAARMLSERQLSQLVRGTSDYAICMLDPAGRVAQWNTGAVALMGYETETAIGLPFAALFVAEDRATDRPDKALREAAANGIAKGEWLCVRYDGSRFHAHGTLERLLDPDGTAIGYSLITRDITQIHDAQAALAEKTRQLDTALAHMTQGLCMFDAQERMILGNPAYYRIWGIPEDEWGPGSTLRDLVEAGYFAAGYDPAGTLANIRNSVQRAREQGGTPSWTLEVRADLVLAITEQPIPGGGWIATFEDITVQRRSEERIAHMAMHDALTGLPNRNSFYKDLEHTIERAGGTGDQVAIIAIDLDRFKEINDTFGHASGDLLLRTLADRFAQVVGKDETIARLGGDEFAAAIRFGRQSQLDDFLTRIKACILAPVADENQPLTVGASLGVAIYPQDGPTRETLLNNADLAMYRAKATLGETVCFFEPGMDESARERRQLANDLRHAAERGELRLLYQPQRSLRSDTLAGYEALVRWHHPRRGLVSPADFIPIAEETGEIIPLGEWVLRQACMEARSWAGGEKVAVNLSPVQFLQQDLVGMIRAVLVETGLPARRLELEITETAIIADKLRALHCLRQIMAMGVSVAIDDFGTGYSSLDTLQSFPFDKIKIDKSFLMKSEDSAQARAIIRAVLALGKSVDIPVLAEGVETESQLRVLEAEGCDEAQGYFFGRPGQAPSLDAHAVQAG